MKANLSLPDVSCGHCKTAVENALQPLQGIESVVVDVDAKTVTVDYEPPHISRDRIESALAAIGYPVSA